MRKLGMMAITAMLLTAPGFGQETAPPAHASDQSAHQLEKLDVETWLDGIVPYALASGDMAGAVVTIVADGKVLTTRGFGDADAATGQPVDAENTLFRPGSISKLMTWSAVMQLVERGKLDLDADINDYLDFTIPSFAGQPISMRNIMTHTAGFEEQLKHVLAYDPADVVPLGDLVKEYLPTRIYAPGTTPRYADDLGGISKNRSSETHRCKPNEVCFRNRCRAFDGGNRAPQLRR